MGWIKAFLSLKDFIELAVILVEHPGGGSEKKENAIQIVHRMIDENGISMPLPTNVLDVLIGISIDLFVAWMNTNFWKEAK